MHDVIKIYVDGGSRGNRVDRGRCAIAVVVCDSNDQVLFEKSAFIGLGSNNWAEYKAIIEGLNIAKNYTRNRVEVYSDSVLVINQLNGIFQVKNIKLRGLYEHVKELEKFFHSVIYSYVSRYHPMISKADRLLNLELDTSASR